MTPGPNSKFSEWQDTLATLHMWTQVVGKIRLEQTPLVNHWWNVPLYVSARGLTTSAMPYQDGRIFEIEFDFIDASASDQVQRRRDNDARSCGRSQSPTSTRK